MYFAIITYATTAAMVSETGIAVHTPSTFIIGGRMTSRGSRC